MNKYLVVLCGLFSSLAGLGQTDDVGSGRALLFDGVDDYVDFGDIYDDLALPITMSVWVYTDPSVVGAVPIFDNQDGSLDYNGFAVVTSHVHVGMTYGDGQGGNNPAYRRSKAALMDDPTGKWINITTVFRGKTDMDIYVNGVNMGGDYEGYSNNPMNSFSPSENAKMGYWYSNGNYFRYTGIMDEFRIWNRALSETEIRQTMCKKLKGNEPGLIGYWNFDETSGNTVFDKSPNGFDGTLKGNLKRVYSSAPIGDESVYAYPPTVNGVNLTYGADKVQVSNVQGNSAGIHIYAVNSLPSQTDGLPPDVGKPYFGVFSTSLDLTAQFDVSYQHDGDPACKSFQRNNNSIPAWTEQPFTNIAQRTEIIRIGGGKVDIDLGPDQTICNQPSLLLTAPTAFTGKPLLWSTGETSPAISVTASGNYWLKVSNGCREGRDTVSVMFQNTAPVFSLDSDEVVCSLKDRKLSPLKDTRGVAFLWQNGSTDSVFVVHDFGKYWVSITNACGTATDSVAFRKITFDTKKIPNVITPGNDLLNENFMVEEGMTGCHLAVFNRWGEKVYDNPSYQNTWNGGSLASGVYFYILQGDCIGKIKGSVTLVKGD